ncbi:tripartite tricarboxylate transporter permease [Neomoorella mulderi]|uniref:Tripartite tricarboxylate transporter TctA family protein n=1 Tax=Moorella mulderi DSM 14980 TaxID=1122241 RepID=A0A151AVX2_9FIRM|nr:tripartite tricarboxylate transporter permease [Moorella mulderi]KYH31761.1 tripartite tricarboxylate transporter TctA family protein [Moorella mulderi DSM 14980]
MILDVLLIGLNHFFTLNNFIAALSGCFLGMIFGALPGFTASMGVAILLPVTYGLSPDTGLVLLASVYVGAMYGGSIPAILMHTPGTPGAAATILDGYPMAQKGQAATAIVTSATSSAVGSFLAGLVLVVTGPILSFYAARISPAEIFLVSMLGIIVLGNLAGSDPIKGFLGGITGLLLGTVGADFVIGYNRFTFGFYQLYEGIPLVPALVGLLALSECFVMVQHKSGEILATQQVKFTLKGVLVDIWEVIGKRFGEVIRASAIGAGIGFVPGEGAAVANFVAYDQAKRASRNPKLFGTGIREGVIASEASNNAVVPMALLPALALGIPGSSTAALILSGVMMHGLRPGPGVFERSPEVMGTFLVGLLASSLLIVLIGIIIVGPACQVAKVDCSVLAGVILVLAVIGVYAVRNSFFDVGVMLVFGLLGYALKYCGCPPVTAVVGFVLGPICEKSFTTAISVSGGSAAIFFFRPVAAVLWVIIIFSLFLPRLMSQRQKNATKENAEAL